ncbi:LOW QUALITY PROTEIN: hypothetical protein HID58_074711 [Brassica napus]|uniref:DUF7032 domain-containing protein n=2 Tax=Brassica TaxID=3705 RepID=A0ABQ7YIV6_BRANA|nr:LOW QUALITY PROTEIN: hypothetical protein HID58_074711 [Brassica napus]
MLEDVNRFAYERTKVDRTELEIEEREEERQFVFTPLFPSSCDIFHFHSSMHHYSAVVSSELNHLPQPYLSKFFLTTSQNSFLSFYSLHSPSLPSSKNPPCLNLLTGLKILSSTLFSLLFSLIFNALTLSRQCSSPSFSGGKLMMQRDLDMASSFLSTHISDLDLLLRSETLDYLLRLFTERAKSTKIIATEGNLFINSPQFQSLSSYSRNVISVVSLVTSSNVASRNTIFEKGGLGPLLRLFETGSLPLKTRAMVAIEATTADSETLWEKLSLRSKHCSNRNLQIRISRSTRAHRRGNKRAISDCLRLLVRLMESPKSAGLQEVATEAPKSLLTVRLNQKS